MILSDFDIKTMGTGQTAARELQQDRRENSSRQATLIFLSGTLLLLLFLAGLGQLFWQRFAVGDFYPVYSSLRSDPLGAKILAESLEVAGHRVERNFSPLADASLPADATMVFSGLHELNSAVLNEARARQALLAFVNRGGRLVLTLFPQTEKGGGPEPKAEAEAGPEPEAGEETTPGPDLRAPIAVAGEQDEEWGKALGFAMRAGIPDDSRAAGVESAQGSIQGRELALPWHGDLVFEALDPAWLMILSRDGEPVLIERRLGKGSVVLATDSYFLSNEALWHDRQPWLLSWLAGPDRPVIFDEMHHGIRREQSIGTLIRHYNLHGVSLVFLVLALLFLWRSSQPLLPPHPERQASTALIRAGRTQFECLVNMIRRHAPRDLLSACVAEWRHDNRRYRQEHPEIEHKMEAITASQSTRKPEEIVAAYQAVCRLLAGKPRGGKA